MLLASPSDSARLWFEQDMESQFEISKQCNKLSYFGITIKKSNDGISFHQRGYIDNTVSKFKADPLYLRQHFFISKDKDEKIEVTKYIRIVMSLMFLARFTRTDILVPVTYPATKSGVRPKTDRLQQGNQNFKLCCIDKVKTSKVQKQL